MMNSSYDDEFAPNPFRTQGQQQQHGAGSSPQQQDQPASWLSGGGGSGGGGSQPPPPSMTQPDPYSGMTGPMDIPPSPPNPHSGMMMHQQQQPTQPSLGPPPPVSAAPPTASAAAANDPSQWSGTMDQRAAPVEHYGGAGAPNNNNADSSSAFSRFGWRSCVSCFQLNSYVQYFDMETDDIRRRLQASLLQFWMPDHFRTAVVGDAPSSSANTTEEEGLLKGPDLYGPVWISFTLIFLIAVTSNIQAYWDHKRKEKNAVDTETEVEEFEVDIRRLLHASSVVLCFVFVVASCFWLGTTCMGMPGISWAMWVCCYGYSQVAYMPATVLIAVLPFELISWCALGAATGASVLLVLRNLSTPLMAQDNASQAKAAPFVLAILAAHTFYFLVIKVWFFP